MLISAALLSSFEESLSFSLLLEPIIEIIVIAVILALGLSEFEEYGDFDFAIFPPSSEVRDTARLRSSIGGHTASAVRLLDGAAEDLLL